MVSNLASKYIAEKNWKSLAMHTYMDIQAEKKERERQSKSDLDGFRTEMIARNKRRVYK